MMDSREVHTGDPFRTEQINRPVRDLTGLDRRVQALEQAVTKHKSQPCRNCLADIFFVGLFEVTVDNDDGTYDVKERYISNTGVVQADAISTADMTGDFARTALPVSPLNGVEISVGDEVLVLGGFDAGTSTGEPIARYLAIPAGGIATDGIVKITGTSPLKGDLKRAGTAMSSWDTKSGSHYSVTDEGNGCVAADDVFPASEDSSGTWHIASIFSRLKDTS